MPEKLGQMAGDYFSFNVPGLSGKKKAEKPRREKMSSLNKGGGEKV